jgi:hypothetical protein
MNRITLPTEDAPTYLCPCCDFRTLQGRGGFEICSVCFWEDDGQDDPHADEVWGGPNRDLSLTAARANYAAFGACDWEFLRHVRPPTDAERRNRLNS